MDRSRELKSVVRKDVRVRLPPSAPILFLTFSRPRNSVAKVRRRSCQITPPSTVRPNGIRARSHAFSKPRSRSLPSVCSQRCLPVVRPCFAKLRLLDLSSESNDGGDACPSCPQH